MTPVAIRAAPAARENSEKKLSNFRRGAIPQRGQIGDQTGVPKQNRDRKIGRNRKHVPYEGAPEVWPDPPVVRHRRQVPCHPDTPHVHARKNGGANNRKKRHRFRRPVNGSTPFLAEQEQDGGDERASVPDTDPENEVRDVPGPTNRDVISPGANAGRNLEPQAKKTECRDTCGDGKSYPPPAWRGLLHDAGDSFREPTEVAPVQDQRNMRERSLGLFNHFRCCRGCVHFKLASANCQLPIAKSEPPRRIEHGRPETSTIGNRKSKIENSSSWFLLQACNADVFGVRHFRIWVANARKITRP